MSCQLLDVAHLTREIERRRMTPFGLLAERFRQRVCQQHSQIGIVYA